MAKKRCQAEDISHKLHEANVLLSHVRPAAGLRMNTESGLAMPLKIRLRAFPPYGSE